MTQFFAMGGYGAFVWSAYGVTALGLGAAIVLTLRAYFRAKRMSSRPGDKFTE
jgi:heme exporter protein CcmD